MFRRRRRKERSRWLLAGFAPLVAGSVWVIREAILRRSRAGRRYPQSPQAYGLQDPTEGSRNILRINSVDPGEEFADTPLRGDESPMGGTQEERFQQFENSAEGQVPVTAKKKPPVGSRSRTGAARVYESDASQGAQAATPRTLIFDEGRKTPFPWLLALIPLLILGVVTFMGLRDRNPPRDQVIVVPGGNVENGRQAIQSWGCGSCHTIPGVAGAQGKVGPELDGLSERTYIAGILSNTPENMIQWIMNPQEIQPGNAMPDTDVPEPTARDMAAYLYSLK